MDELVEHLLAIELQKAELKLNDYMEYLNRVEGEDKAILGKVIEMLDDYIHELDRLKR